MIQLVISGPWAWRFNRLVVQSAAVMRGLITGSGHERGACRARNGLMGHRRAFDDRCLCAMYRALFGSCAGWADGIVAINEDPTPHRHERNNDLFDRAGLRASATVCAGFRARQWLCPTEQGRGGRAHQLLGACGREREHGQLRSKYPRLGQPSSLQQCAMGGWFCCRGSVACGGHELREPDER